MVCRQTDRTSVPLAGITRRSCICTNPRKVRSRCARREAFEKPISVYRPTCAWPHGTCVAVLSCLQWGRRPLSPRLWKDPFARSDSPFPPGGLRLGGAGRLCSPGPGSPSRCGSVPEGLLPAAPGGHRGGTVVPAREAPRPWECGRRGPGLAASAVGSGAAAWLWGGPCV